MGLLATLANIWKNSERLCSYVDFSRVYTGRIPGTELVRFPYVSMMTTAGWQTCRTDKTMYSRVPLTFHVWADDAKLAFAEEVGSVISDVYANTCWEVSDAEKIIDILDGGPGIPRQTNVATVKAWEIVQILTVCLERERAPHTGMNCCDELGSTSFPSSFGSSYGSHDSGA